MKRADQLSIKGEMKLGIGDAVRISAATHAHGTSNTRHKTKHLAGDIGGIFSLGDSSEGRVISKHHEEAVKVL